MTALRITDVREPGQYADFEGKTYASKQPFPGEPAVLKERTTSEPSPGFGPTVVPGEYSRRVDEAEVTNRIAVQTLCRYRGGGPFVILRVRPDVPGAVTIEYHGPDRDWAANLPGFTIGDQYDTGSAITGTVPFADLTDVAEEWRPAIVPPDKVAEWQYRPGERR